MPSRTRRWVLAAVGLGLVSAGCVADPDGADTEETTTSERPTETTTDGTTTDEPTTRTTTDDPNTTGDWIEQASNEPDPDLPVYLNNDGSETRMVRVRVVRERTGETVFEETRENPGGTEYAMYNLKQADPEGVESFRVCGELVDSDADTESGTASGEETTSEESDVRGCATVKTNECYGTAHVAVEEGGSLAVFYSIC
jgi:hypothetical protein